MHWMLWVAGYCAVVFLFCAYLIWSAGADYYDEGGLL